MTPETARRGGETARRGLDEQAVLLAAGLANLAVSTVGTAFGTLRGLLRRADAGELAAEAEHDLTARGRLVLDRYAAVPPAHLEILARHTLARRTAADD
ncbi:polyprenyl synthetase [Streptomyces sp. NPDC051987]|uniref:polyprenyl synthetase n=1 Tax=Streptomyces sp. NPDC051987 TaxID=3155808 RepID=UPI0034245C20